MGRSREKCSLLTAACQHRERAWPPVWLSLLVIQFFSLPSIQAAGLPDTSLTPGQPKPGIETQAAPQTLPPTAAVETTPQVQSQAPASTEPFYIREYRVLGSHALKP